MSNRELKAQIRQARGKFAAMVGTYALSVFNDNFFKQATMLLAVAAGQSDIQGKATVIFSAPYLIFSAPAGWMADRFSKRNVLIAVKVLEIAAMIFGAIGICTGNMTLVLVMLGIMGTQAAIFSPSLNGSIPELYPASYVTTANAILRVLVTGAILLGIASAGFALDADGPDVNGIAFGCMLVAVSVVGIAALGALVSLAVPRRPAAAPKTPFPWTGPIETLHELYETCKDPLLAVAIAGNAFIWFVGSLQALLINQMGLVQLGLSKTWTSGLVVAELLGFAAGGLISSYVAVGERWHRALAPAAIIMVAPMALMGALPPLHDPLRLILFFISIAVVGIAGGVIMIPCESFIQVRPRPEKKGAVIAAANFAAFAGILLSGPVANILNSHIRPTDSFLWLGALSLTVGVTLWCMFARRGFS